MWEYIPSVQHSCKLVDVNGFSIGTSELQSYQSFSQAVCGMTKISSTRNADIHVGPNLVSVVHAAIQSVKIFY